jgi:hypothetical protein
VVVSWWCGGMVVVVWCAGDVVVWCDGVLVMLVMVCW